MTTEQLCTTEAITESPRGSATSRNRRQNAQIVAHQHVNSSTSVVGEYGAPTLSIIADTLT